MGGYITEALREIQHFYVFLNKIVVFHIPDIKHG